MPIKNIICEFFEVFKLIKNKLEIKLLKQIRSLL